MTYDIKIANWGLWILCVMFLHSQGCRSEEKNGNKVNEENFRNLPVVYKSLRDRSLKTKKLSLQLSQKIKDIVNSKPTSFLKDTEIDISTLSYLNINELNYTITRDSIYLVDEGNTSIWHVNRLYEQIEKDVGFQSGNPSDTNNSTTTP